ncbi:MAG: hypothetical protein ACETV0_06010 [Nitrososphaeria archaeon]
MVAVKLADGERSLGEILEADRAEASKAQYVKYVRDLADALNTTPDDILESLKANPEKLPDYVSKWLKARQHLSSKTVENRLAGVKVWLMWNDHYDEANDNVPYWRAALRRKIDRRVIRPLDEPPIERFRSVRRSRPSDKRFPAFSRAPLVSMDLPETF